MKSDAAWSISPVLMPGRIRLEMRSRISLAVRQAAGVFPDGTPFRMPDDDPLPPPIDVDVSTRAQTVYLSLPLRRSGAPDVDRAAED